MCTSVYEYDRKVRIHLARTRSMDFHVTQVDIFTQVFDANSLKVSESVSPEAPTREKRCHRCDSTDHLVKKCPFRPQASGQSQAAVADMLQI